MPSRLHFARYREIAEEIAPRLAAAAEDEVIVSSGGLAATATAELIRRTPSGVVSARMSMLDTFARRVVNENGDYPRVASDAEQRISPFCDGLPVPDW